MHFSRLQPSRPVRTHSLYVLVWLVVVFAARPISASGQKELKGRLGVNLAGAEFPPRPGIYGKDYLYPNRSEMVYYKSKGMRLFRIPFSWERMQPTLGERLQPEELARLDQVAADAHALHVKLVLDIHGYDRRDGKLIGADPLIEKGFADVWLRLAQRYQSEEAIYAYGLMNEPHDTAQTWPHTAQAAIDSIRTVDQRHYILLAGDHWSNADTWAASNPHLLDVKDPENRLIYEAHIYWDSDGSGVYKHSYDGDRVYPDIGVDRVRPFIEWLKTNRVRGFIGEFGVPNDDPRWNQVLDRFLHFLRQNDVSGTYWAGGPLWHHYRLSCEPNGSVNAPQMAILEQFSHIRHWWSVLRWN